MATTSAAQRTTTRAVGPYGKAPPRLGGALPLVGHMLAFARDPVALMRRVREECGPAGEINLLGKRVVLLSGTEAQEAFCRAPDEQLSQKIAYRLMTPVFGRGVVFEAPIGTSPGVCGLSDSTDPVAPSSTDHGSSDTEQPRSGTHRRLEAVSLAAG